MVEHLEVRSGTYHDSVTLMQVSRAVGDVDGVEAALVAMATELNLGFLEPMGFEPSQVDAGPNDLLVAIRADDDDALARARSEVDAALARSSSGDGDGFAAAAPPRTTASALRRADADLVLVSTPGAHAATEALDAVRAGANVMIFSDNVPIDVEVALKREAVDRDVLVMGPDCGTAIVGGVGLGFANVVAEGPVGVVAASGTGAQQLSCLLDEAGVGISHVLGVGGRDLTEPVGGRSTLAALRALDLDPGTELIVVLSKPPHAAVAERIGAAAAAATTSVVLGMIGPDADDLTAVATTVLDRLGVAHDGWQAWAAVDADEPTADGAAAQFGYGAATAGLARGRSPRPGLLRGLFAGGTLATEAAIIASRELGPVRSNVPLEEGWEADGAAGEGHLVLDLGADEYTRGRPHPMIDDSLRVEHVREAGRDPDVAVLLLDVVLGHGAGADPSERLAPAIAAARRDAAEAGRDLAVVVSLCGSRRDPQGRDRQVEALRRSGASVHLSNADAAREAVRLIARSEA